MNNQMNDLEKKSLTPNNALGQGIAGTNYMQVAPRKQAVRITKVTGGFIVTVENPTVTYDFQDQIVASNLQELFKVLDRVFIGPKVTTSSTGPCIPCTPTPNGGGIYNYNHS